MERESQNVPLTIFRLGVTPTPDKPLLSSTDINKLRQHHYRTIGLFIAFWVCAPCVVLAIELLDLSERTIANLVGALFGALIVSVILQFYCRCPACRANLGWQCRLGIPRSCRKCGVTLRENGRRET